MRRTLYLSAGFLALGLGIVGAFLPLLPTVPFVILAAFCFARGSPAMERRLLDDPRFGPSIRNWRERGAISRKGKLMALAAFAVSAAFGVYAMAWPLNAIPVLAALIGGSWIWTRPTA